MGDTTSTAKRPKVLLAEDDALIRYAVRRVLEPCCDVVAEAADGAAAVELAQEVRPDVVLLDISMPVLNGFEAARRIKKRLPEVPIVIVSSHSEREYIEEAFRVGARGYVFKGSAASQLPSAIAAALSGQVFRPLA